MHVDVVIDVVCPWCYVGKRRLDAAQAAYESAFEVTYRPFLLAPDMPREGKDRKTHFAEKFGKDFDMSRMTDALMAQAGDIDFRFDAISRVPNTIDAHRVIAWAANDGRQEDAVEALFKAYFTNGADIGDREVLTQIATDSGMNGNIVADLLATEQDREAIRNSALQASGMGIQGVPFYIFDGTVGLSGAQDVETLLKAAAKAEDARAA